jgi:spore maturation protein CgeB
MKSSIYYFTDISVLFSVKIAAIMYLNHRAYDRLKMKAPRKMYAHAKILLYKNRSQIKGRNFEIPAACESLLTKYVEGVGESFIPGKEIVKFIFTPDLHEKIHDSLSHDIEHESIRLTGYRRALREDALQYCFKNNFNTILNQQLRD